MAQPKRDPLKGIDIFAEEILVNQGNSKLSAALRAQVLTRAHQMRTLEQLLDRKAVEAHRLLLNRCPLKDRAKLAWDLLRGRLGEMKIPVTAAKPNQQELAQNENK